MSVQFTTPPGRIVWGHSRNSQDVTKKQGGVTVKVVDKDGVQKKKWAFGLAIPKADCADLFEAMNQAAAEIFPNGAPPSFAWKFKDGDGVDNEGKKYSDREGFAGCFVFALETQFQMPPNYDYHWSRLPQYDQQGNTIDPGEGKWVDTDKIKRGDVVAVALNINPHKAISQESKPGLYMNPDVVMLYAVGPEIKGGSVDPNARGFAPPPPQTPPANVPAPPGSQPPTSAPGQTSSAAPPQSAGPRPPGGIPSQQPTAHTQFLRGPTPDAN